MIDATLPINRAGAGSIPIAFHRPFSGATHETSAPSSRPHPPPPPPRAKGAIDAAPEKPWPIPTLARLAHVCPKHFAGAFRAAFALPPHRYQLTRRLESAAALLRDTDLSITAIAFKAGVQRGVLDQAASGLRQFLFLTDGLHRLLGTLEDDPVFQSVLWHHLGYWYGERRGTVVKAL